MANIHMLPQGHALEQKIRLWMISHPCSGRVKDPIGMPLAYHGSEFSVENARGACVPPGPSVGWTKREFLRLRESSSALSRAFYSIETIKAAVQVISTRSPTLTLARAFLSATREL